MNLGFMCWKEGVGEETKSVSVSSNRVNIQQFGFLGWLCLDQNGG